MLPVHSGGSRLGLGGTPPNLAQAPQIFRVITVPKLLNTGQLDTVVLLVVASQMMRGQGRQAPKYFFLEPPLSLRLFMKSVTSTRKRTTGLVFCCALCG